MWRVVSQLEELQSRLADATAGLRPEAGRYLVRANGNSYRKDGTANFKEALGFLKDWVTAIVQLETVAIGVIGTIVGFTDLPRLPLGGIRSLEHLPKLQAGCALAETFFLIASAACFGRSIRWGYWLLNALPGAAQRVPADVRARTSDIFSIANEPDHPSLYQLSGRFRSLFGWGIFCFIVFIAARLARSLLFPEPGGIG